MSSPAGTSPTKMAVISVEWAHDPESAAAVRETIESTMDGLLLALHALDVEPSVATVMS